MQWYGLSSFAGASSASDSCLRIYISLQNAPGGADQNVVGALRLKGALDQAALQGALQNVMQRHDALRTRFAFAADGTLQQVCSYCRWCFQFAACHASIGITSMLALMPISAILC